MGKLAIVAEMMQARPSAIPKGLRHACPPEVGARLSSSERFVRAGTTAIYGDAIGAEEMALAARLWEE